MAPEHSRPQVKLQQVEEKFFDLIESLPMVAVQGYDINRRVIYWNNASTFIYGYTFEEARGQLLEDLIIPEDMRDNVIQAHKNWLENNVAIPPGELLLRHKDGYTVPVFSSHVLLKVDTGEKEMFCIDVNLAEQKRAQESLRQQAEIDKVTGLYNRHYIEQELVRKMAQCAAGSNKLAVIFIDIDNFKFVNDALGHNYGDQLLQSVAARLSLDLRSTDVLARFGGDEFVMLVPNLNSRREQDLVMSRIMDGLAQPIVLNGAHYQVTASIGVSIFPNDGETSADLLGQSDAAMYRAKENGKNHYCYYTNDIREQIRSYQSIVNTLGLALKNNWLRLHFQPVLDLKNHKVVACESLLRCFPEDGQPLSPAEFIPVAEKSSLILDIDEWVVDQVCQQKAAWKNSELRDIRLDINLSANNFTRSQVDQKLLSYLTKYRLSPEDIGVELTEHEMIDSSVKVLQQLFRIQQSGSHIAIDDFGTGYSSLLYLKRLPVNSLKIDQGFLANAMVDSADMAIMEAIVTVGHRLGLTVVVEGVETKEQDQLVRNMGCDFAQGYYYSRPIPPEDIHAYVKAGS